MLGSVLLPSQPSGLRRNTYTAGTAPPLPPRRNSLSTAPAAQTAKLQLKISTLPNIESTTTSSTATSATTSASMESRYKRSSSPRRYVNPGRSSTGTFADPYYESSHYARPSSPRTSAERIGGSHHPTTYYVPSSSTGSRAASTLSSSYGRPRRNTGDTTMARPTVSTTSMPIRTPYTPHSHLDRPSSPLAKSWDKRGETYITQGPTRTQHKKIYSVDDSSHSTQLVAERELELARSHRDSVDRGYGVTSGSRTYHNNSKPPARLTDLGDDGYSYTDPASMYRDTEPAWRRPRASSIERSSRPSSMIVDRPARSSARELGPPPSVRGFDKINNAIPRPHARSSSIDRSREIPKYDPYPDTAPSRSSSTRHHTPAIHQEPRDHRRDTYHDPYDRRDREVENRRHNTVDHLPDPQVSTRGFGIAPGNPALAHDHHALDREPIWKAQEPLPPRADDYGSQYHSSHRADARMPDPRASRDRDLAPPPPPPASYDTYDKRPRDREPREPRERENSSSYVPAVAGAATGVAATLGAAGYMKSRDREKERESSEERERERERERRRAYDALDSRDKEDRRDRRSDDRDDKRERRPDERRDLPPAAPAYAPPPEADRKPRERRYEDDDRERSSRKAPSSEGSGDERPRHYVDRDAERRRDTAPKEAVVDPDEDYRRRVQQEAERASRAGRDRDQGDSDRERERRPRKDEADRARAPEERSRASPPTAREPPSSRYDERSSSVYDANLVQEPESFDKLQADQPNKSVTIVTPPKEPLPQVKGILRKPTEKFPEEPEPIREGVAPHKDALKGKDIPIGARWTRIDRRLVNPQALEEAKERFEERMDCVIVLRVLTKQEIQKLADRTKKIRERREEEYDDRDRDDRDDRDKRSSYHGSRDDRDDEDRDRDRGRDKDRERRRRYDDEGSEYEDLGRERERERDRPKMLEPAG
ncbi:hypothetical protein BKA63DRAFT_205464 [Paraphoma chrysanthemicola]|nr:hypothetical protein BKA63DRAFT_205464 [Paraphoma chrysanthemicola]